MCILSMHYYASEAALLLAVCYEYVVGILMRQQRLMI